MDCPGRSEVLKTRTTGKTTTMVVMMSTRWMSARLRRESSPRPRGCVSQERMPVAEVAPACASMLDCPGVVIGRSSS